MSTGRWRDHNAVTATVTNPATTAVVGDVVNFTAHGQHAGRLRHPELRPVRPLSPGVLPRMSYTSPFVTGVCTITATEATAATGESAPADERHWPRRYNPTPTAPAVTVTGLATTPTPASVLEGGTGHRDRGHHAGITRRHGAHHTGIHRRQWDVQRHRRHHQCHRCGDVHLHRWFGPGNVAIGAVETLSGVHATAATLTVTAPTHNAVAVTANPASVVDNGTATSTITATVTGPTGAPVAGDVVGFTALRGTCGTITPAAGSTNSSGVVTVTYTSVDHHRVLYRHCDRERQRPDWGVCRWTTSPDLITHAVGQEALTENGKPRFSSEGRGFLLSSFPRLER